jgi:hypothetical protein
VGISNLNVFRVERNKRRRFDSQAQEEKENLLMFRCAIELTERKSLKCLIAQTIFTTVIDGNAEVVESKSISVVSCVATRTRWDGITSA